MDLTPHVNFLKSLRGERVNYGDLIGEGVDNALDAGASTISASIERDSVRFEDDGVGITKERIIALFTLGAHSGMATTQLGRFGVGITSQAINFGNRMIVISRSVDGRVNADVDWRNILKSGEWTGDDPRWRPGLVGEKTGTTVIIEDLRVTPKFNAEKIVDDLAMVFFPAIASGRKITFNGHEAPLLREPQMTDIIDVVLSLSGDRSAHVRAGILLSESKLCRVHVSFRHRVIMPNNTIGCSGRSGLNRFLARVELSGTWHFHKFKNELTSEAERDELEEALSNALQPILEKCDTASMDAKLARVADAINAGLPDDLSLRRPEKKRTEPPRQGNKDGTIGEVDKDKATSEGPAKSKRPPRDQLVITFDGRDEQDGIGALREGGRFIHVDLSKDNPFVSELVAHRDERLITDCLRALALMIYEAERKKTTGQDQLAGLDFGRRVATHLRAQQGVRMARS